MPVYRCTPGSGLVADIPAYVERNITNPGEQLVHQCLYTLMHPANSAGELTGLDTGYKLTGHLIKWAETLYGKR